LKRKAKKPVHNGPWWVFRGVHHQGPGHRPDPVAQIQPYGPGVAEGEGGGDEAMAQGGFGASFTIL